MKRIVPMIVAVACLALLVQVTMNWHTMQGIVLFSLGEHSAAISRFQTAVDENPDDLYAQFYLGQSYFEVGNFSQAIDHLRIATILVPSHHKAQYLLGSSLAEDKQIDVAISTIKKAIESSPGIALYHYRLGLLFKDQGTFPEALDAFSLAADNGMEDADLDFNRAHVYLRMDRPGSARRLLQSALKKDPKHFFARLELARMLQIDGQLEEAFTELDRARQLDPGNQQLHRSYFSLGIDFGEQQKLPPAIRALSIAANLALHIAEYHYQLGHLYRKLENTDAAAKALARAIALNPRHPHAHPELAKVRIAQGRIDEAIHEFQLDIEISPKRFFSHYDLGLLYIEKQEFAAARESLENAAVINPHYPHTCAMLLKVYQSLALGSFLECDLVYQSPINNR